MPIARPNRTSTTPRPAPPRRGRAIRISGPQNPAATLAEATGTWNFAVRVWIAFDPPTAATPNWIDISGFVEQDSTLTINRGRTDGLSDVTAGNCSLTVDNSDGRFFPANPNGIWFGQVDLGNWLKIEIFPPSGTVSQRFVGFITSLPNQWSGQYQTGQITASDRFEKLGRAPTIISSIQSEVLTDPNLVGNIKSYWNLHEASSSVYGRITFGDTSGNLSAPLVAYSVGGLLLGTGMGVANVNSPGFDGLRALTFNPPATTQGTYLTAAVAMPPESFDPIGIQFTGLYGVLEFWFQATTTGVVQYLASIVDPVAQFAVSLWVGTDGYLNLSAVPTAAANSSASSTLEFNNVAAADAYARVDDGTWHHIVVGVQSTSAAGGWTSYGLIQDGRTPGGFSINTGASGDNLSQLIVGGGYTASRTLSLGAGNFSDVSWTWAPVFSALNTTPAPPFNPNYTAHAAAGLTGFLGESTDIRVARIARYGGVPIPLTVIPFVRPNLGSVLSYSPGIGPWTNLSAGAHYCGTQSMAGRKPLDLMQEAAHTEGMPLYVDRSGFLEIQPSTTRQNTSPAWSVNALELDPSTAVADDYAYVTNQMTITPNGQAAQTVIGGTGSPGRLSQAKYDVADSSQATASINPIEAQSLGLGYIQLRAKPVPRLAPLAIEVATVALLPGYGSPWYDAVLATEISTPIRVTNAPVAVGGGNYDCLVEGWTETITAGNHLIQYNVSQIQGPTYQLDDVVLGHLDTDGTTLTSGVNTVATTLNIATTSATGAAWTTNPADFPFDVLVDTERMTATAVAPVALGVDGTFETGASGWTLSHCTLVQSPAQAHSGSFSGLVTSTAGGSFSVTTPQFAVNALATYQSNYWFRLASGTPQSNNVTIQWFTSGGGLISTLSLQVVGNPATSWLPSALNFTAPATAGLATVQIAWIASGIGDAVYIDDVTFPLLTGGQQQMTVTRSVNGVVATHSSGAALALNTPLTLAY